MSRRTRETKPKIKFDVIKKAKHYNVHPSGVECIVVVEHMTFCSGNAVKYLWRAGLKGSGALQDLKKAEYYIKREVQRVENAKRKK